jgi:hypothetical protein
MHLLKILVLLLLTVAVMRLVSWFLLWLLGRVSKRDSIYLRLASNVLALCAFAALLVVDSVPGETLDRQALVSGVVVFGVVFGVFFGLDVRWLPRFVLRRVQQGDAQRRR